LRNKPLLAVFLLFFPNFSQILPKNVEKLSRAPFDFDRLVLFFIKRRLGAASSLIIHLFINILII